MGVWGAVWLPGGDQAGFVCLSAGEATMQPLVRVPQPEDGDWELEHDGVELIVSPAGAELRAANGDGASSGFDQLCRVRGRVTLGGAEHALDCLGHRAVRSEPIDLRAVDSVRDVSAWFEPGEALAVVAVRPRKARGQDADLLRAAVLDAQESVAVTDPRLSTTYTAQGRPVRAGLELWLGDEEHEYPRRAAGEAVGPRVEEAIGELAVQANLFRWHSRAHDGVGVYILARRA